MPTQSEMNQGDSGPRGDSVEPREPAGDPVVGRVVGMNRLMAAAMLSAAALGCSADSRVAREWAGTVYDSAGVTVVANPAAGLWTEATAWSLKEELRIGVVIGDPMREFGFIAGLAVDDAGRIYVLDSMAREIRVFDPDGKFLSAFAQRGSGPGELNSPSAVLIGGGDTILVPDVPNGRVQRFLTDGSPAGQSPMDLARGFPLSWATRDGLLLEELRPHPPSSSGEAPPALVLLRDGGGQVVETLLEMEDSGALQYRNGMAHMVAFSPEPRWALLEDGRLVSGRLSAYRLEIRDRNGRMGRVVTKSFEPRPLRDSDRQALRERIRGVYGSGPLSAEREQMIRTMEFGTHFPAFASLFGGPDGTLWVQQALQVSSFEPHEIASFGLHAIAAREYDIFDREGRYQGTMTPPRGFDPMMAQGEHLYGVQRDDLDVQYVVRLRVVR